jgi:hypothetical protein
MDHQTLYGGGRHTPLQHRMAPTQQQTKNSLGMKIVCELGDDRPCLGKSRAITSVRAFFRGIV